MILVEQDRLPLEICRLPTRYGEFRQLRSQAPRTPLPPVLIATCASLHISNDTSQCSRGLEKTVKVKKVVEIPVPRVRTT